MLVGKPQTCSKPYSYNGKPETLKMFFREPDRSVVVFNFWLSVLNWDTLLA